eukprot:TRINITY_DN9334_c0_g8_i1.p1 TRINITY_DN9334_c0_g8~~TRINITY_DN9334_c0_g8_i1.p1  ORF type:complete len:563 (-),score=78.17 TRINITY_DN9334_c0_g8_i1:55-1743(-)
MLWIIQVVLLPLAIGHELPVCKTPPQSLSEADIGARTVKYRRQGAIDAESLLERHLGNPMQEGMLERIWDDGYIDSLDGTLELIEEAREKNQESLVQNLLLVFQAVKKLIIDEAVLGEMYGNALLVPADYRTYSQHSPFLRSRKLREEDLVLLKAIQQAHGNKDNLDEMGNSASKLCDLAAQDVSCQTNDQTNDAYFVFVKLRLNSDVLRFMQESFNNTVFPDVQSLFLNFEESNPNASHQEYLKLLTGMFPNVQALGLDGFFPVASDWGSYFENVLGISYFGLSFEGRPLPDLFCKFQRLRLLGVRYITSLPQCLEGLTDLIHLDVRQAWFTSSASINVKLPNLINFVSFQNGAHSRCSPLDSDGKPRCRLLYERKKDFYTDSDENLSYQCPEKGWHLRFDDPSTAFWTWSSLQRFWVDANWFSGSIPDFISGRWPRMRSLDLYNNNMSGPLPAALLEMKNLTKLQLQDNDFSCSEEPTTEEAGIVARLARMPNMDFLFLDSNPRLCGCIPAGHRTGDVETRECKIQIGRTRIHPQCSEIMDTHDEKNDHGLEGVHGDEEL